MCARFVSSLVPCIAVSTVAFSRRPRFLLSPIIFPRPPVAGPPSPISSPMRPSSNTFETDPAVNTKIIHLESSPGHNSSLEPRVTLPALRAVFGRCQPYPVHLSCTASISMLRCHTLDCPLSHPSYLSQLLEVRIPKPSRRPACTSRPPHRIPSPFCIVTIDIFKPVRAD